MKKVLFATTALVATAGVASADVTVSGYAEMGIAGGDAMETQFHQDIDVTFSLSGTTDNGLTFGAAVDIDERSAGSDPADDDGVAVFISGNFGTLTMGDTDGALDWAVTEATGNPGSIADNETGHAGYRGSFLDGAYDGQILRYDYSFGDFGFAVSTEMDDSGVLDNGMAIGLRYNMELGGGTSLALGAGYQTASLAVGGDGTACSGEFSVVGLNVYDAISGGADLSDCAPAPAGGSDQNWVDNNTFGIDMSAVGLSAVLSMASGVSFGVAYTRYEGDANTPFVALGDADHVQVSMGYTMDALSIGINYGELSGSVTTPSGTYSLDASGWGLAAAYDLGGGAGLHLGYGSTDGGNDTWSLGLAMSF
jgi:outer membrane protein OmpU